MHDHAVVEELDVAGAEIHVEPEALAVGERVDQLHGLDHFGREPRHLGKPLGGVDVGAAVHAEQPPVPRREARLGVVGLAARRLLAADVGIIRPVEHREQIRARGQDLVVNGGRAGNAAQAAALCRTQAEQADDVALVVVERQAPARVISARRRILVLITAGVAHVDQKIRARRLRHCGSDMEADSPIDEARALKAVALDRQAPHQHDAGAVLHFTAQPDQRFTEPRERERLLAERDVKPLLPHERQRAIELGDIIGRDLVDPAPGRVHLRRIPDCVPLCRRQLRAHCGLPRLYCSSCGRVSGAVSVCQRNRCCAACMVARTRRAHKNVRRIAARPPKIRSNPRRRPRR